jgi:SAM-dependent MidA family methyltransferase
VTRIDEVVRAAVRRHGSLPFDRVMAAALYDPDGGFYATGGRAGRRGDFLTSPEVGPLFGAVVARALDRWWAEAGRPEVFVVVEAGAGPGTLARAVLQAGPGCGPALRYVLVESSAAQRALHTEHLTLESPVAAFASIPDPDLERGVPPPPGPIAVSLAELPRLTAPCVVLANELLDNLPCGIAVRAFGGWAELHVADDDGELVELLVPLDDPTVHRLIEVAPDAPEGARVPLPRGATAWLAEARATAGRGGRVVAIDYARPAAELATWESAAWLRTYRGHEPGGPPLADLGSQDITAEVPIDLLHPEPDSIRTQAEWLVEHGLDDLVAEGRRVWRERAAVGDLAAVRARSRVHEAEALTDPTGLGAFQVLEWRP